MSDKQDFLNKINEDRSNHHSFIRKDSLSQIHERIINKTMRMDPNAGAGNGKRSSNSSSSSRNRGQSKASNGGKMSMKEKAEAVMQNDMQVKEAMQNLILSLSELGDKEIATQILGQHIIFLNDIFKEFE